MEIEEEMTAAEETLRNLQLAFRRGMTKAGAFLEEKARTTMNRTWLQHDWDYEESMCWTANCCFRKEGGSSSVIPRRSSAASKQLANVFSKTGHVFYCSWI